MKGIAHILMAGIFVLATTSGMAAPKTKTTLHSNWMCTTNASSSDKNSEKMADKTMGNKTSSASGAFTMASKHCRDCTKITCTKK